MKDITARIDHILDNFNFNLVARTMRALNWTWTDVDGVPEVPDLRKEARRLLRDVAALPGRRTLSCGGFVARKDKEGLSLSFEIAESDDLFYADQK